VFAGLSEVGVETKIRAVPFDLGDSPPFAQDTLHHSYDADSVERWGTRLTSPMRVSQAVVPR
jgi:hypothetical protein